MSGANKINLLAFAQSKELFGFSEKLELCSGDETPRQIVSRIAPDADVSGLRVAVDCEFADWDKPIGDATEIAFLPPVSGG
jgi:molybdopterin converting factor small subunit